MREILQVALYLIVKCPKIEKRTKYMENTILNISEENQGIIISILQSMGIWMGSPEQYEDGNYFLDDEDISP
jgi:hypothetical protein